MAKLFQLESLALSSIFTLCFHTGKHQIVQQLGANCINDVHALTLSIIVQALARIASLATQFCNSHGIQSATKSAQV